MFDGSLSEKLSQNFQSFLTYFIEGNIDYQIGVTTTTVSEPPPAGAMPGCEEADVAAILDVGYLVQNAVLDSSVQEAETILKILCVWELVEAAVRWGLSLLFRFFKILRLASYEMMLISL